MARYTVHTKDLKKGAKMEAKEHPWASPTRARRIARDHLQREGPGYYRAEPVNDQFVKQINKRMGVKRVRRRKPPAPFNPLVDDPFRKPVRYRTW